MVTPVSRQFSPSQLRPWAPDIVGIDMKKVQVVKFWRSIRETTYREEAITSLMNKKGYGGRRTLQRYSQAYDGFRNGSPPDEVASRTGWSLNYVNVIHRWWAEEFSSPRVETMSIVPDLQQHRDELLRVVIPVLDGLRVFEPRHLDIATWHVRPHEPSWPIAFGRMERTEDGRLSTHLLIEGRFEWLYLRQHLEGDPLWSAVADWKEAMARDVASRLALLREIFARTEQGTRMRAVEDLGSAHGDEPALDVYYPYTIYDQVFSRTIGIRVAPKSRDEFMPQPPHTLCLGGRPVIRSPDAAERERAVDFLFEAQTALLEIPQVREAKRAYDAALRMTEEVKRIANRIRLAVALPTGSTCDGCRKWVETRR